MNAPADAAIPTGWRPADRSRRLFMVLALGIAAVVFVGFARSYYLKGLFGTRTLSLALHMHGLLMSAWFVLFVAQTWLIATRRTLLHRQLGIAAAILAALIVPSGVALTVVALAREVHAHVQGKMHYLLLINVVNLLLFGAFVGSGLLLRARAAAHKRLMLLAAVTLLAPAAARAATLFAHGPVPQLLAFYACIAACVLADTLRHGRLHPVLGWGALAIIAAFQLSYLAVLTPGWMLIVHRLFGG